jgi:hypothetical protein
LSLEAVNLPATTTGPGKLFQSDGLWEEWIPVGYTDVLECGKRNLMEWPRVP